jgi:hypothetical protein
MRKTAYTLALAAATIVGLSAASAQERRMSHDGMNHGMAGPAMRGSDTMEREMSGARMGRDMQGTSRTMERSSRTMEIDEPRTTGTVRRGASRYAPGQVKKVQGGQSARQYAPGQRMRGNR